MLTPSGAIRLKASGVEINIVKIGVAIVVTTSGIHLLKNLYIMLITKTLNIAGTAV